MFLLILLIISFSFGIGLEEALQKAIKSPQLEALKEGKGVFEGLKKSAEAFPNPEVRIESGFLTNDKTGKPRGRALFLFEYAQPIPLWNVRSKGKEVVQKEKKAFEQSLEVQKRFLLGEVYRLFHEALTRKEILNVWQDALKTAEEIEEFVRKAYELGEVTQLELFRAKREKGVVEIELHIAKSQFQASLKSLSGLLNEEVKDVEGELEKVPSIVELKTEELPLILSLKKKIEALERSIELEKALAKPRLSAGFVVEDSEEGYYGLRGALSFEFPIFYRRQGEIIQKVSLKRATAKRLEAELVRINNLLASIKLRYETLLKEFKRMDEGVLPQAQKELELAIRSYRLRAITLLELSDVRKRYYELLINRAELLRELHSAYAEFISIGGWKR